MGDCIRPSSPEALVLWPRGTGATLWTSAGSTARTEICMPVTQCMGGQDSSWLYWHVVLIPTAPTEELLFMDNCQTDLLSHLDSSRNVDSGAFFFESFIGYSDEYLFSSALQVVQGLLLSW